MRVGVVDDEAPARRRLARMLGELPGVTVVMEASDGLETLTAVERTSPELLFLDIQMPGLDGLALAARYAHLPPVVFVTAFDRHALAAFEVHAVDFLLKPVRSERLAEAVRRAQIRIAPARDAFAALPEPASNDAIPRVVSHDRSEVRLFDARRITRFTASEKYTSFRVHDREYLTEEPLASIEQRLAQHGFVRIHRAELVRASSIVTLRGDTGGHEVELDDGQVARVSRRLVAQLRRMLGL